MKDSGEIYAQFTLSRINSSLKDEPLSDPQIENIRQVLIASEREQRHAIDMRLFIPAIFRNYYIIVFAGRDRRRSSLEANRLRLARTMRGILRIGTTATLIVLSFAFAALGFWGLYLLKSALGIDLIPGFHLSEWVADLIEGVMGDSK